MCSEFPAGRSSHQHLLSFPKLIYYFDPGFNLDCNCKNLLQQHRRHVWMKLISLATISCAKNCYFMSLFWKYLALRVQSGRIIEMNFMDHKAKSFLRNYSHSHLWLWWLITFEIVKCSWKLSAIANNRKSNKIIIKLWILNGTSKLIFGSALVIHQLENRQWTSDEKTLKMFFSLSLSHCDLSGTELFH